MLRALIRCGVENHDRDRKAITARSDLSARLQTRTASPSAVAGLAAGSSSGAWRSWTPAHQNCRDRPSHAVCAGFADAVVRLWKTRELWEKISVNGRQNDMEHSSAEAAAAPIAKIMSCAGLNPLAGPLQISIHRLDSPSPPGRRFQRPGLKSVHSKLDHLAGHDDPC